MGVQINVAYFGMTESDHGADKNADQHGYDGALIVTPLRRKHPCENLSKLLGKKLAFHMILIMATPTIS
jgi:hypothetical protein